jgi:hypothetical protein
VNRLSQNHLPCAYNSHRRVFFLYGFVSLLWSCSTPATFEGMVPTSFETAKSHPQTVRVYVTGGQESVAVGRPQITNSAFSQALTESITKSRTFSRVVEDQSQRADYLLTVTLFSMDKRVFGRTVKMEGWLDAATCRSRNSYMARVDHNGIYGRQYNIGNRRRSQK